MITCPIWFFFCSVTFYCQSNVIFLVGYVFCFGYYFYRLVGIVFFNTIWFRIFFKFLLLFSLFGSVDFREVTFLVAVVAFLFSGWTYMIKLPYWCVAVSGVSFLWSLFRSYFVFFSVFVVLCLGSHLISFSGIDISAPGIVILLFLLSFVICSICSTTFGTSDSFSFDKLSRSFLSVIDVKKIDISNSALLSGKAHFFKIQIISLSRLLVFPYLFVLPKRTSSWVVFVSLWLVVSVVYFE